MPQYLLTLGETVSSQWAGIRAEDGLCLVHPSSIPCWGTSTLPTISNVFPFLVLIDLFSQDPWCKKWKWKQSETNISPGLMSFAALLPFSKLAPGKSCSCSSSALLVYTDFPILFHPSRLRSLPTPQWVCSRQRHQHFPCCWIQWSRGIQVWSQYHSCNPPRFLS